MKMKKLCLQMLAFLSAILLLTAAPVRAAGPDAAILTAAA